MEAHIKGHANEMPDDEKDDDNLMIIDHTSAQLQQLPDNKQHLLQSTMQQEANNPNDITNNFINTDNMSNIATVSSKNTSLTSSMYPETPKDSETSSEQNSDGDDITYMNMYSRFEQSVVNSYGMNSGVNSALLAVASITASATIQPVSPTSSSNKKIYSITSTDNNTLITLQTIQPSTSSSSSSSSGSVSHQKSSAELQAAYETTSHSRNNNNNGYYNSPSSPQVTDYK